MLALATVLLPHAETRPDTFRVERSIRIQVPAEKIDPSIRPTCSGAANDKGAVYGWNGSNEVGHRRMEISMLGANLFSGPFHLIFQLKQVFPSVRWSLSAMN